MSNLQARNEAIVNAPISKVWSMITDISLLPDINPGVIKAFGKMNELYGTRTCEIQNKGRKGTITERLVEMMPERKTVWKVESDTMGLGKMLRDTRFYLLLERITDASTRLTAETYYTPANLPARIMNGLMMKKMMARAQEQILRNIQTLSQKH